MEPQSKINDMTIGICDHGLPCCPHFCIGIRFTGSPDMTTNSQPSSRLTDLAYHSCFHPTSPIFVNGKFKQIRKAKIGDTVVVKDGSLGIITDITIKPYKGMLKHINVRGGYLPLIVTPDHHIWSRASYKKAYCTREVRIQNQCDINCHKYAVCDGLAKSRISFKWKESKDLVKRDLLYIPRIKPGNISLGYYKGFIYGRYVGDGSLHKQGIDICFGKHELKEATMCKDLLEKAYGRDCRLYDYVEHKSHYTLRLNYSTIRKEFARFGKSAKNKHLPSEWIHWDLETRRGFVNGYVSADGHFNKNEKINGYVVSTISRQLAQQFNMMLHSLGFLSNITKSKNKGYGGKGWARDIYVVNWAKEPSGKSGCVYPAYNELPIFDITEEYYDGDVYDITVSGASHDFATPWLVSNCPHCSVNMCIEGSGLSSINGLASHRMLDMVTEFCGVGITISGSPDVIVGG